MLGHDPPQKAHAVEARHAQVGDDGGDAGVRGHERERLFAVTGLEDLVTVALEDGAKNLAQIELVVGEHDTRASAHVRGTLAHMNPAARARCDHSSLIDQPIGRYHPLEELNSHA